MEQREKQRWFGGLSVFQTPSKDKVQVSVLIVNISQLQSTFETLSISKGASPSCWPNLRAKSNAQVELQTQAPHRIRSFIFYL